MWTLGWSCQSPAFVQAEALMLQGESVLETGSLYSMGSLCSLGISDLGEWLALCRLLASQWVDWLCWYSLSASLWLGLPHWYVLSALLSLGLGALLALLWLEQHGLLWSLTAARWLSKCSTVPVGIGGLIEGLGLGLGKCLWAIGQLG